MATKQPKPFRSFRHARFGQNYWNISDISIGSSGHIVLSGGHKKSRETFIDIYGKRESQSPYSLQFDKISYDWRRFSSLFGSTSDVLVTCSDIRLEMLQVKIEGSKYKVLRVSKLKGKANCLTVEGGKIFVGLFQVNHFYIFNENLEERNSIFLGEFENGGWPYDVQVFSERLFVCTAYDKVLSFRQPDAKLLTEFNDPSRKGANPWSVTGNKEIDVVCILWDRTRILIYSLSKSIPFLTINVDEYSSKIRISDKGCIIIAKKKTGEVEMYSMRDFITYTALKDVIVSTLRDNECIKLMEYFNLPRRQIEALCASDNRNQDLLLALEERNVLSSSNVSNCRRAFTELSISSQSIEVAKLYQNTRSDPTMYQTFLGTLSAHFTAALPGDLCDYFKIVGEDRERIISGQNPGLYLLSALSEMGVIKPSMVGALEEPLKQLGMIQAVAKIHEYQANAEEEDKTLSYPTGELSYEEKKSAFVGYLKKKIQHWYETTTPVPWKKSCRWKISDLFIGSGLIITDARDKKIPTNIDEGCKLHYTEIFIHEKLKSKKCLAITGEPGSGKTMLMSQLAYDWSEGKFGEIETLLLLPLKLVGHDGNLAQAIKDFYIPYYSALTTNDVKRMLLDKETPVHLLLDGLEEYGCFLPNFKHSELMKVMSGDTYPACTVVVTARSDFLQHLSDLPTIPTLRLGLFGENERQMYIQKVFVNNKYMQQKVSDFMQENSFILHLCSIPLTFALAVHNIEILLRLTNTNVCRVGPFMKGMVETLGSQQPLSFYASERHDEEIKRLSDLLPYSYSSSDEESEDQEYLPEVHSDDTHESQKAAGLNQNVHLKSGEKQHMNSSLVHPDFESYSNLEGDDTTGFSSATGKLAFNGLCRGIQQLSWQKEYVERIVGTFKTLVDSGIFVIEEVNVAHFNSAKEVTKLHKTATHSDRGKSKNVSGSEQRNYKLPERNTNDASKDRFSMHQDKLEELAESEIIERYATEETLLQVPLQVKFLHKIIQEWFAAKYLSFLLWKDISSSALQECLDEHMPFIPPDDLHYVLRFTCFLCPPSCHLVVQHLMKRFRCRRGKIPEYVMNCIFLCLVEGIELPDNASKFEVLSKETQEALMQVCEEEITICSDDSLFLQQAKITVLTLASTSRIPMSKLRLNGIIVSATGDALHFNSGMTMGVLNTLEDIEIGRWDHVLKEEDHDHFVNRIIEFIGKCRNIKTVQLHFPFNPSPVDRGTLATAITKTVIWIIGGRLRLKLNTDSGKWEFWHRQSQDISWLKEFPFLETETTITFDKQQTVTIAGTKVELTIPPYALSEDMDKSKLKLRIIPRLAFKNPCEGFSSNSSVIVEVLPNNARLKQPVKLRIPHCLLLEENAQHEAKIYMSHHEEGDEPQWEEQFQLSYIIEERSCILFLDKFCWVTMTVGDRKVLGKRVLFYASGKSLDPRRQSAEVAVGYYHNLDGEGEFLQHNRSIVSQKMPYTFLKEGERSLSLRVKQYSSDQWELWPLDETTKVVPFGAIDAPFDFTWTLLFKKQTMHSRDLMCVFEALQEEGQHPIELKICIETVEEDFLRPKNDSEQKTMEENMRTCFLFLKKNLYKTDWKDFGRYLNIPEQELNVEEGDFRESTYQMLLYWQHKNGPEAHPESLRDALIKVGRMDLIGKLREIFS